MHLLYQKSIYPIDLLFTQKKKFSVFHFSSEDPIAYFSNLITFVIDEFFSVDHKSCNVDHLSYFVYVFEILFWSHEPFIILP